MEFHVMAISEDGNEKSSRSSHGYRDIDVVSPDDFVTIDDRVHNGVFQEGLGGCLQEERHESQLDVVLLKEFLSEFLRSIKSYLSSVGGFLHVYFLEGCQHSISILGVF